MLFVHNEVVFVWACDHIRFACITCFLRGVRLFHPADYKSGGERSLYQQWHVYASLVISVCWCTTGICNWHVEVALFCLICWQLVWGPLACHAMQLSCKCCKVPYQFFRGCPFFQGGKSRVVYGALRLPYHCQVLQPIRDKMRSLGCFICVLALPLVDLGWISFIYPALWRSIWMQFPGAPSHGHPRSLVDLPQLYFHCATLRSAIMVVLDLALWLHALTNFIQWCNEWRCLITIKWGNR